MSALERLRQACHLTATCGRSLVNAWCVTADIYDHHRLGPTGLPPWRRTSRPALPLAAPVTDRLSKVGIDP